MGTDMFKPLDCNDEVLLFNGDTFTVGRFKELLREDFASKSSSTIRDALKISVGRISYQISDFKWNSTHKDCQILIVGSKGWQKGKIRFQLIYTSEKQRYEVYLEFCPDEPTVPESPLDALRQSPEYKQQS